MTASILFLVIVITVIMVALASAHINREVVEVPVTVRHTRLPPIFLSTLETTPLQRFVGAAIAVILAGGLIGTIPFAEVQLPIIENFTPVVDALLAVMLAFIAFILIGQFLRLRTWSILILANGFIFKLVFVIAHVFSYPGFILSEGLLGGMNTSAWLYVIWHGGFPLFLSAYGYLHGQRPRRRIPTPAPLALILSMSAVLVLAIGIITAIAHWGYVLPTVVSSNAYYFARGVGPALILLDVLALIMVWQGSDSVLDLWLLVSTWSVVCNIIIVTFDGHRYELSYYIGWLYELASAMVILGALMEEMNRLYASLFSIMEQQQLSNTAEYRSVVDTALDAIIVIDESATIQSFNKAAEVMFGYEPSEVLDHNVKMLMPEPYSSAHDNYVQNYLDTGIPKVIGSGREVQARRKDGSVFPIELSVAEWYTGAARRFTGVIRDLSERKRIEQQLIQSQKMEAIGQLTGGMAHDFNNLLGVVIGNLDMLADRFPEDDRPVELQDALDSANAGADLVRRLLAFARRQPLLPKPMRIDQSVDSLMPLVRRIIGDQILIEVNYDPDLLPVLADQTQFENALLNLCINARDAMPRGGKLEISCRNIVIDKDLAEHYDVACGHYTTLVVRDNGIGIPAEILPHVIEPFYTTKPPGTGSGLGLSMVFGYAKQSGGVLRIYSEPNKGTEVRVHLPSIVDLAIDDNSDQNDADIEKLYGNERILMVEDTLMARTMVQRMLLSLGYYVRVASDATEAMLLIDAGESFDLLFTDIVMPGKMDGIELAHQVRKRLPLIKVLFTSGFSSYPESEISALTAGYITKPYRKLELAQTLRNMLSERTVNGHV